MESSNRALDVDSRLLGRPSSYDGTESQWEDWPFQMRAYLDVLDDQAYLDVLDE